MGSFDSCLRGRRIGTDKATRSEERPAKVAGHHAAHVLEAGTVQHLERRHAGRAAWLTIVRTALPTVRKNPSRHIVSGVMMARAHLLDEGVCLGLA